MKKYAFIFSAMGCSCKLCFYADSPSQAEDVKNTVLNKINFLDKYYTNYSSNSFTAEINRKSGDMHGIIVDPETSFLLNYSQECYYKSDGLFDITAGVLRKAWDYQSANPQVPSQKILKELLNYVGWNKVNWNPPHLILPIKGMHLDLGGVVKEYAADIAASLCLAEGINYGFIDLGGDISVFGPHPDGSPWIIGIKDPLAPNNDIATVKISQGGIASSGDYERYFEINGVRYGHILNPKTGWPSYGVSAVSVISPQCLVAGSLATIAMLSEGEDILKDIGIPYILLDSKADIIGSSQLTLRKRSLSCLD